MTENEIGTIIVNSAYEVHTHLGPGLLESTYEACMLYELRKAGLKAESQKPMPVFYKEIKMDVGYRVDILVEDKVIIENKAVTETTNIDMAQIIAYLKLADCRLGYLINFNVRLIKDGIRRIANRL